MTDVFLSYANEDRERASKLASSLEACDWSVWWNRKIIADEAFAQFPSLPLDLEETATSKLQSRWRSGV
jgi:hypothetical protein